MPRSMSMSPTIPSVGRTTAVGGAGGGFRSGRKRRRQTQHDAAGERRDRQPAFAFGLPFRFCGRRQLLLTDGRFGRRAAFEVFQRLGRRPITLRRILFGQPLDDVGQVAGTPCSTRSISGKRRSGAACHIIQAICRSRPNMLSPGKERLELAAAHQLVGGEAQRIQVAVRARPARTGPRPPRGPCTWSSPSAGCRARR